jgi:hypothetical protein
LDELKAMQAKLEKLNKPLPKVYAAYYGEDWKTQGDWMGRAFRDWAVLCGAVAPMNHPVYFSDHTYTVNDFIGPHHRQGDCVRRWVHWLKTDNPKSLWNPFNGYRRQSEWDDHGETYLWSMDGPDLWYLLEIHHAGTFRIGMYFFNKDGHTGANRVRDYMLEIYPAQHDWMSFRDWQKFSLHAEAQVRRSPPLAKSRMHDFWGGVYKQFLVTGPCNYYVKIDRNYSFNTIISAVMIDRLTGVPLQCEQYGIPCMAEVPYDPPPFPVSFSTPEGRGLLRFWKKLDSSYNKNGTMNLQRKYRIGVYQTSVELGKTDSEIKSLADSLKWRLNQWDDVQRQEHQKIMKQGFEKLLEVTPSLRQSLEDQKKGVPEIFKNWSR